MGDPKVFTVDELVEYVKCPARWLYQCYYDAGYRPSPVAAKYYALRGTVEFILTHIHSKGSVLWDQVVDYWHLTAAAWAVKAELDKEQAESMDRSGLRSLVTFHRTVNSDVQWYGVNLPWVSQWPSFNIEVHGNLLAFGSGGLLPKYDNLTYFTLDILPFGILPEQRHLAHLTHMGRAVLLEREGSLNARGLDVKHVMIHIKERSIEIVELVPMAFQSLAPLVANAVNSMYYGLVTPHEGEQCGSCPYEQVCKPELLSRELMKKRDLMKKRIEYTTCGSSTSPTS